MGKFSLAATPTYRHGRERGHRHSPGPLLPQVAIVDIVAISSTQIRVYFREAVVDNAPLNNPEYYVIEGPVDITVVAVTPDVGLGSLVLTTTEHRDTDEVEDYELTIIALAPQSAGAIVGTYAGIGDGPTVENAVARSLTLVRVTFDEAMSLTDLDDASNYTIVADVGSNARVVSNVVLGPGATPSYVDLELDGQLTEGTNNYDVEVGGVFDAVGNPIAMPDTATFSVVRRNSDPRTQSSGEGGGGGIGGS